jgi:hypothetical protein
MLSDADTLADVLGDTDVVACEVVDAELVNVAVAVHVRLTERVFVAEMEAVPVCVAEVVPVAVADGVAETLGTRLIVTVMDTVAAGD